MSHEANDAQFRRTLHRTMTVAKLSDMQHRPLLRSVDRDRSWHADLTTRSALSRVPMCCGARQLKAWILGAVDVWNDVIRLWRQWHGSVVFFLKLGINVLWL